MNTTVVVPLLIASLVVSIIVIVVLYNKSEDPNSLEQKEEAKFLEGSTKYGGNNGTVSGDFYCKGGWENNNKGDKKLTCIKQTLQDGSKLVGCSQAAKSSTFVWCKATS